MIQPRTPKITVVIFLVVVVVLSPPTNTIAAFDSPSSDPEFGPQSNFSGVSFSSALSEIHDDDTVLLSNSFQQGADDENNNRTFAEVIEDGEISGEISVVDDVDWYVFEVEPTQRVSATIEKPIQEGTLVLEIWTPDGVRAEDSVQVSNEETIGEVADTTRTSTLYYLRVSSRFETTTVYNLSIENQPTDSFESNEDVEQSQTIATNETIEGEITEGDVDWFRFTADEGQRIGVEITKSTGPNTELFVELSTADGVVDSGRLRDDLDSGLIAYTASEQSTYFLLIRGVSASPGNKDTSPYSFVVQTRDTDSFEPNENGVNAVSIPVNETIEGEITEGDVDWFRFTVDEGQRVAVNIAKSTGPNTALFVELSTADGVVDSGRLRDGFGGGLVADTASQQATYLLRIQGERNFFGDRDTSPYSFVVETRDTDNFEPNENRVQAVSIPVNETIEGEITEGDIDWFRFTPDEGQRVAVDIAKSTGPNTELVVDLSTTEGVVDSGRLRDGFAGGLVADTTSQQTTYFLRIQGQRNVFRDRDTSPYSFVVETRDTDDFEPNENRVQAVSIPVNETIEGEITEGDVDWFRFTVDEGQRVAVDIAKSTGPNTALVVELSTANVEVDSLRLRDDLTNGFVADTASQQATYLLRIQGNRNVFRDRDTSPYSFVVKTRDTDDFEPNENRAQAKQVTPNELVRGEITENEEDWFTFTADTTEPIVATLRKQTGIGTALSLELYSPDEQVDRDTVSNDQLQSSVFFEPQTESPYYVRITGVRGNTGEYQLSVDFGTEVRGESKAEDNASSPDESRLSVIIRRTTEVDSPLRRA